MMTTSTNTLTLIKPDDFHSHLRDGQALLRTAIDTAQSFARAIIMPNLTPPITTVEQANQYRQRILENIPENLAFTPLMTLYLTDNMTTATLRAAKECGFIYGIKLYPRGATTNSESGVTDINTIYPLLEFMQDIQLPLLIHGEVNDPEIEHLQREAIFIEKYLHVIRQKFPALKIVLEHASTKLAVEFVRAHDNIAATITPHHLLFTYNDLFAGGLRPHRYCLPILKSREDRLALIAAATSGDEKFFLGTDSAPHERRAKESTHSCAGIYNAPVALAVYTEIFEKHNALDKLEAFTSKNGAAFYGLLKNTQTITLQKKSWQVPDSYAYLTSGIVPMLAGQTLQWQIYYE